jgi:S1-C subfamily serine protease
VEDEPQEPASTDPGTPSPPPSLGGHDPSIPAPVEASVPSTPPLGTSPTEPPAPETGSPGWATPPAAPTGTGWLPPSRPPTTTPTSAPPFGGSPPSIWPPIAVPPEPPKDRTAHRWLVIALVSALIGGVVGAGVVGIWGRGGSVGNADLRVGSSTPGPALAGDAAIPSIVKQILPEVVSIDAKGPVSSNPESLFGDVGGGVQEDQGTGMIISTDGEVITNNHVISGATTITVTLFGQTKALPTTLVGADPSSDVALLKIDSPPANLKAITFGNSGQLEVGDAVIAVGNALGLSAGTPTVTSGIVSATGRTVQASDSTGETTETLSNIIQTDAAINSGNSGGALVDSSGQVIGMNTAVASSSEGNAPAQNIGFAIPVSTIEGLLSQLRQGGTVKATKAYMGVEVEDDSTQLQQSYGFVPSSGAVVVSVESGSPADNAGIEQGDVIVSYNGKAVKSAINLTTDVQASPVGSKISITLWRGQNKKTVSVTLAQAPAQ